MKKSPISKWAIIQNLLPYFHIIVTILLVYMVSRQDIVITEIREEVSCDYFINVEEYAGHTVQIYSTGVTARSEAQIMLEYEKQITAEQLSCDSGLCLDSARIILYRDCSEIEGDYEPHVLRDTLLAL